jgi:hypothetical protein
MSAQLIAKLVTLEYSFMISSQYMSDRRAKGCCPEIKRAEEEKRKKRLPVMK